MKTLVGILIILMSLAANAGDASDYKSLGFSTNGKYYAFIQDGNQDGSGFYWIELGIIDVAKNQYVGRASIVNELQEDGHDTDDKTKAQFLAQLKSQLKFNTYGFPVAAQEQVLIHRPHFDFSNYTNSIFSIDYWAQGGASTDVQTYEILLNEVKAPVTADNDWCDWYPNNMIELRLKKVDLYDEGSFIKDLQIDTQQPKKRACSSKYKVAYAMRSKDSLAVVLEFSQPGFEGPNYRYMVVTSQMQF